MNERGKKTQHDTLILIIHSTYMEILKDFDLAVIELLAFQG